MYGAYSSYPVLNERDAENQRNFGFALSIKGLAFMHVHFAPQKKRKFIDPMMNFLAFVRKTKKWISPLLSGLTASPEFLFSLIEHYHRRIK